MKYPQLEICAIIALQVLVICVIENSTQSPDPLNTRVPKQEILTTSVQPGPNVWVGESIALECKLSHATPTATAVWHRVLLDPAGRKLRSLGLEDNLNSEMEIIIVRERTAELISHGELLLISDPRFRLKVHRGNHSIVYRLEIESTKLEDSGDYECQMTSVEGNDQPNPQKVLNQRIEVNVFQRHVSKENEPEEKPRTTRFQIANNKAEPVDVALNKKKLGSKVREQEASSMQVQQSTMAMEIGSQSIMSSSGRLTAPLLVFLILEILLQWL